METPEQQFNSRVSAFLGRTGMKPTTLGMKAVGNPGLSRSTIYRWRVAGRFPRRSSWAGAPWTGSNRTWTLVVHNPMGILITCLQADLALVTGESS